MINRRRLARLRARYVAAKDAGQRTVTVSTAALGLLLWSHELDQRTIRERGEMLMEFKRVTELLRKK